MKIHACLPVAALVFVFALGPLSARSGPTNATVPITLPTASPAEVDAFLKRWKPVIEKDGFLGAAKLIQETNALANVLGALDREPGGVWVMYLRIMLSPPGSSTLPSTALAAWKRAIASLTNACEASPTDAQLAEALQLASQNFAEACLEAGELDEATVQAKALLAQDQKGWNYGNVIYDAHSILGRSALRQGKLQQARQELLAAGQTPGSPQLNSFGPRFTLARELLQHGEPADREAVAEFLDGVARFWANPDKAPDYRKADVLKKLQQIETWKAEVRAGKTPNDPKWR